MKFTFKIAVEIRKSHQPEPCDRPHADEAPEQLASCADARLERSGTWFRDEADALVTARRVGFGPSLPVRPARSDDAQLVAPAPPTAQQPYRPGRG